MKLKVRSNNGGDKDNKNSDNAMASTMPAGSKYSAVGKAPKDEYGVLEADKVSANNERDAFVPPMMSGGEFTGRRGKQKKEKDPNVDYSLTVAGIRPGNNSTKVSGYKFKRRKQR